MLISDHDTLFFCLAEIFLSRYLTRPVDSGSLIPISSLVGMHAPTHFLYADDVVLFCRASTQNLRVILNAFELYGPLLGQQVNCEKSSIYFGKGISGPRITDFLSNSPCLEHVRVVILLLMSVMWGFLSSLMHLNVTG